MNLIRCNENETLVNMDNVSYVYPAKSPDINKRKHQIYFVHIAMNADECMETIWSFSGINEFSRVLSALEAKTL